MADMIPMTKLLHAENVRRTKGYDLDSLATLAESIKLYGVMTPISVTRRGGRYLILAGHRRVLAAQMVGLEAVPAHVIDAPEIERSARQIAENLERADLSLADMATAVRKLYDEHGSVAVVAEMVSRSPGWVSKHLALTADASRPLAIRLVAEGVIADLEVAHLVAQLEKHKGPDWNYEAARIEDGLRLGTHNRATLRKALDAAKGRGTVAERPGREQGGTDQPQALGTLRLTPHDARVLRDALDALSATATTHPLATILQLKAALSDDGLWPR